jgi:hypothetical protein
MKKVILMALVILCLALVACEGPVVGKAGENCVNPTTFFEDNDGDGFGTYDSVITACDAPFGYATSGDDCDDTNPYTSPDALEVVGDGIDQDCDGVDIVDNDGDGYYTMEDCDDTDASINPDAYDILDDSVDQDCDGIDAQSEPLLGDVDGNRVVDGKDSTLIAQHVLNVVFPKLTSEQITLADVNCDGAVTLTDATILYADWNNDEGVIYTCT